MVNRILQLWLQDRPDLIPAVDCGACSLSLARPHASHRWHAYKCCTFQPFVANFLAGAMIEAGLDPLAIDGSKALLLPIGVVATRDFRAKVMALSEDEHGESELCSYYDRERRRCRVWSHRPGECSAHFCAVDGKAEREVLSQKLFQIEHTVAQKALLELGFTSLAVGEQIDLLNDPILDPSVLDPLGARSFYLACWASARKLTQEEVLGELDSTALNE